RENTQPGGGDADAGGAGGGPGQLCLQDGCQGPEEGGAAAGRVRGRPVRAVLPSETNDSYRAVGGHREGNTLESGSGGDRHARRRPQGDINEAVLHRDKGYQDPPSQ
ncbi:MAG: hypothetical protein ACK56F_17235, partial [bacterium]